MGTGPERLYVRLYLTRWRKYIGGPKNGQRNDEKKLGFRNRSSRQLVGILVMNLLDVAERGKEDVEKLRVEMLPTMFGHEFDRVVEAEGRFVNPLCGQGIEGVGNRSDPSFHGNRFAFQLTRIAVAVPPFMVSQAIDAATLRISASDPLSMR